MAKYIILLLCATTFLNLEAAAQKERKFIRKGNDLFEGKEFENSEVEYRKALDKKINSYEAGFNLGDALYKQKKYDEALKQFQLLTVTEKDPERLGQLYHNIGNTLLMNRKVDESIEAYKQSLRHFPDSKETKYNLEYARKMKQKQEQEEQKKQKQQGQDQKDQKDQKNKDKQDQKDQQDQKNKDKQDQKDQKDQNKEQQKQQQKNEQEKKEEEQRGSKISKEDAQRLLEALENDEKKVQEKVQKTKAKALQARKRKIEKDW